MGNREGTPRTIGGRMAEVMFVREIGENIRRKIEGYLAHKWGIFSSLPTAHPHRFFQLSGQAPSDFRRSGSQTAWFLLLQPNRSGTRHPISFPLPCQQSQRNCYFRNLFLHDSRVARSCRPVLIFRNFKLCHSVGQLIVNRWRRCESQLLLGR